MTGLRLVKRTPEVRPTVHETLTAIALYVCAGSFSLLCWWQFLRLVRWVWL